MKRFSSPVAGFLLLCASGAAAENRVFILANPPAKNGIDQCLAHGKACGAEAAHSWCRSREFARARTYRRVDPDEVTGSVPKNTAENCPNGGCDEYVAIICQR